MFEVQIDYDYDGVGIDFERRVEFWGHIYCDHFSIFDFDDLNMKKKSIHNFVDGDVFLDKEMETVQLQKQKKSKVKK